MKRIITYSLWDKTDNSDSYYKTIVEFTQSWIEDAYVIVGEPVAAYQAYRKSAGLSERSFGEGAFELLVLGVLLKEYGNRVESMPLWVMKSLQRLVKVQTSHPRLEKIAKSVRGILWEFARHLRKKLDAKDQPALEIIPRLLDWMLAMDYGGQAERLMDWHTCLKGVRNENANEIISSCLVLADRFAIKSDSVLGPFTQGVSRYLKEEAPRHRWHYDDLFVSRQPVEYHLGMLGTELLSQAYREAFHKTPRKVVILPPCMRAQPEDKCKAVATTFGARCQSCTPGCAINIVTRLGEKYNFAVFMIPDDMRNFRSATSPGANAFGVIGVSCALTNWSGGWDLEKEGIPGQGLLLDFVGCSYHWDKQGVVTETNLKQLQRLVEDLSSEVVENK